MREALTPVGMATATSAHHPTPPKHTAQLARSSTSSDVSSTYRVMRSFDTVMSDSCGNLRVGRSPFLVGCSSSDCMLTMTVERLQSHTSGRKSICAVLVH
ncbi:hypothetical protein HBI24_112130 [Parastagonospora nodorum]|nr:hypothetical protein HBI24_112130 [Parastagonospora nodorum]